MVNTMKRCVEVVDPDYQTSPDPKKLKWLQQEGRDELCSRVITVVEKEFDRAISEKQKELEEIDNNILQIRQSLHTQRYCISLNFYSFNKVNKSAANSEHELHPNTRRHLGKVPRVTEDNFIEESIKEEPNTNNDSSSQMKGDEEKSLSPLNDFPGFSTEEQASNLSQISKSAIENPVLKESATAVSQGREMKIHCKKRIVLGNTYQYLTDEGNSKEQQSLRFKWKLYVLGSKEEPHISSFISSITFTLDKSYAPHDVITLKQDPFVLSRRGWGEFNIIININFVSPLDKPIQLLHPLILGRKDDPLAFTGIWRLGKETWYDIRVSDKYKAIKEEEGQNKISPLKTDSYIKQLHEENLDFSEVDGNITVCHDKVPSHIEEEENSLLDNAKKKTIPQTNLIKCANGESNLYKIHLRHGDGKITSHFISKNICPPGLRLSEKNLSSVKPMKVNIQTNTTKPLSNESNVRKINILSKSLQCNTLKEVKGKKLLSESLVPPFIQIVPSTGERKLMSSSIPNATTVGSNSLTLTSFNFPSKIRQIISKKTLLNGTVAGQSNTTALLPTLKDNSKNIGTPKRIFISAPPHLVKLKAKVIAESLQNVQLDSKNEPSNDKDLWMAYSDRLRLIEEQCVYCRSVEELLWLCMKRLPLYSSNKNDKLCFASSLEEFLSWPLGRQRAVEFWRARYVRERLKILNNDEWRYWTLLKIVFWARYHSFSPLCIKNYCITDRMRSSFSKNIYTDLETLTVRQNISTEVSERSFHLDSDAIIDACEADEKPKEVKNNENLKESSKRGVEIAILPAEYNANQFISSLTTKQKLALHSESVLPGVQMDLAKSILWNATLNFMEDLLRCSHAVSVIKEGSSDATVNMHHVKGALSNSRAQFDLFTNSGLGKPNSDEEWKLDLKEMTAKLN